MGICQSLFDVSGHWRISDRLSLALFTLGLLQSLCKEDPSKIEDLECSGKVIVFFPFLLSISTFCCL
jgi:hypothetical protein